jgi:hypothetical protein
VYFIATNSKKPTTTGTGQEVSATSTVTIMVPADLNAFTKAAVAHVQVGGPDPVPTTSFVAKTVTPNNIVADPLQNVAEAAAEYIPTQAGTSSLIVYFKVVNGTAYVLLNMDIDGWAGVSAAIAQVHPIVEKTLLSLPGITAVKFGPAPGDTIDAIQSDYNNKDQLRMVSEQIRTYTNSEIGFSFNYSSQLTANVERNLGSNSSDSAYVHIVCSSSPSCNHYDFRLFVMSTTTSLTDYLKYIDGVRAIATEGPATTVKSSKNLIVAGVNAVQRDEFLNSVGFETLPTYFKSGKNIYVLTIYPDGSGQAMSPEDLKIYNLILSTFKFTN